MRMWTTLFLTLAFGATLAPPGLAAERDSWDQQYESRVLSDKFWGAAGSYLVSNTTDAAVGVGGGIGGAISLEDTLRLRTNQRTFRSDGFWRFNPRHSLGWTLFRFRRDGVVSLGADIEFEGIVISAGARVETEFKTSLLGIQYQYSFFNNGKAEGGIVAGLSTYNFDIALDGYGVIQLPDEEPLEQRITPSADLTAPVPSAGLFIRYAFFKGLVLRTNAQFFDLRYQDLSGRLVDAKVEVEYYPWRHVGIGGGWNTTDISVRNEGGSTPWRADYRYSGLLFYVAGVF